MDVIDLNKKNLLSKKYAEGYDLYLAYGKSIIYVDQIPILRNYLIEKAATEESLITQKKQIRRIVKCDDQPNFGMEDNKLCTEKL